MNIDLNKMSVKEIGELERQCREHLNTWFGFSRTSKEKQTPEFKEATKWRLEGLTAKCCECGKDYPLVDLHFEKQVFCPEHARRSSGV
jgi:hypothetical protein